MTAGWDAAPAGGDKRDPRTRAAPGLRPGVLTAPRQELADGGRLRLPEAWMRDNPLRGTGAEEPKEDNPGREKRGPAS